MSKIVSLNDKSVRDNTQKATLHQNGEIEVTSMFRRKKVYSYRVNLKEYEKTISKHGNPEYAKREELKKLLNNQEIVSKGLFDNTDPLHTRVLDSQVYAIDKIRDYIKKNNIVFDEN